MAKKSRKHRSTVHAFWEGSQTRFRQYLVQAEKEQAIIDLFTIIRSSGDSFEEIAERAEVSAQCLRNWFYGDTKNPQMRTLRRVAKALGYDFELMRMAGHNRRAA